MNEKFTQLDSGVRLCFETFGSAQDPTVLLVMGLGGPMNWWPDSLCETIAARGFHVVRFDNRDTGRSTKFSEIGVTTRDLLSTFIGRRAVRPPYSLSDMASDAVGLLDRLDIERAHITGVSMGGMIAQTAVLEHTHRFESLVSLMSTTGDRKVGWQHPAVLTGMAKPAKPGREEYVLRSLRATERIQASPYPTPDPVRRRRAEITYDRGFCPGGVTRQMLAVLSQPDRTSALRSLDLPAVVVHGTDDKVVHSSGGRATASAIPGAELWSIPGLDHDLPTQLNGVFADAVQTAARRAETGTLATRFAVAA